MAAPKSVVIVGAGIFGLSLSVALREKGHNVTVFDRHEYDKSEYAPPINGDFQAASVDHNKIYRASYGTKLHYQRLALESRDKWLAINKDSGKDIFVLSGMLRVQPSEVMGDLEKETLANMERDGIRDTQFVKSNPQDHKRAEEQGWADKLLDFEIPDDPEHRNFEAVLDSLAGFIRCSDSCAYYQKLASSKGVKFIFGPEQGEFASMIEEPTDSSQAKKKALGIITKDGKTHAADVVVVAAGSYSTQVLPDMSYHLESSAGSLATFKIDKSDTKLWDKYSPEKFPVITWKSAHRNREGSDVSSVYVLPRTPEGLVKIGFRGIKFTNFQPAPDGTPFTQDGKWSVPLPAEDNSTLPEPAVDAIKHFVSIFLPEFYGKPFHFAKFCWYTDSLDNSFVIDYVPTYADNSVFICTGGSGHGAKFLPVLGDHAADIFENGDECKTPLRPFWRFRPDAERKNGLQEGPDGPRNISK